MKRALATVAMLMPALAATTAMAQVKSSPTLGMAEGHCHAGEAGPAFMVTALGMKDRKGRMRLEAYPPGDEDFLQDDNILINEGKTFRRSEAAIPPTGPVTICVRVPAPGTYTLSLLHDRDGNRKFGLSVDGIGFANNPRLHLSKPQASAVRVVAGPGITPLSIVLNYRHGLLSFGPMEK